MASNLALDLHDLVDLSRVDYFVGPERHQPNYFAVVDLGTLELALNLRRRDPAIGFVLAVVYLDHG